MKLYATFLDGKSEILFFVGSSKIDIVYIKYLVTGYILDLYKHICFVLSIKLTESIKMVKYHDV